MFCSVENLSNLSDTFPHWIIRVYTARQGNENTPSYPNECAFFFFSFLLSLKKKLFGVYFNCLKMANISQLPDGDLGTAPKFGLREEIELVFVSTSSKQCRKRKFNVGFVQVFKEKRAARAKFVVFHLLIGLVSFDVVISVAATVARLRRCSRDLSMCVNG